MNSFMQLATYIGPTLAAVYMIVAGLTTLFALLAHIPGGFGVVCGKIAGALGIFGADIQKVIGWIKPLFGSKKPTVPPVVGAAFLGALSALLVVAAVILTGCLPTAPIVAQTPENANQIASCQTIAADHNGVVIGDYALSGSVAGVSAVAAGLASPQAKTDMSAVAIGLGGALVVGTTIAALTSSSFANSHCSDVVGALPVLPAKPKPVDPPVSVTIVKTGGAQ